ncbi:MAG: hypothetical protein EBZ67_13605, partial [Chitinophagia bacterium]|nr:hypothetical protein [Chitinophagia bacterium]
MRPFLIAGLAMLALPGLGQVQRKWERSLQRFEVAASPDMRIQPGTEALPRETVLAGGVGVAAMGPFVAVSAGWDEDGVLPANSALRISTSKDSLEWTPWMDMPVDEHAVESRWQACTPTVFLPAGSRFFR